MLRFSAASSSSLSSVSFSALRFLLRSSVAPTAMARITLRWVSTSTVTSTEPGAAPFRMAFCSASRRTLMMSLSVGLETLRSTISRTMANATPMVEMTGPFFARRLL